MLWGSEVLASKRLPSPGKGWMPRSIMLCLLPLLATLPGLVLSEGRHVYFFGQEAGLWLLCCSWMLLLIRLLKTPEQVATFLLGLAMVVMAAALVALWHSLVNLEGQSLPTERESGTFGNPNYLACFLVMHIPLFVLCASSSWQSMTAWRAKPHVRLVFVAAALFSLLALFFTQSRVAMLTLAVMLVGLA